MYREPVRRRGSGGVYRAIYAHRDIREFRPDPVPEAALDRIVDAAHHAPSVGLSRPWDFVLVRDEETEAEVAAIADRAVRAARTAYREPRRSAFGELKLQGIEDTPINACVTCDPTRGEPHVLGRSSMQGMDRYSTCLAIRNPWLAARAEGIGVGRVRSLYPSELRELLDVPPHVEPLAYLCIGYPESFPEEPTL